MGLSTGFGQVELFDDFLGQALRGEWQEVTENSGTFAIPATGLEGGVATLTTGTTSGNRTMAVLELNFKPSTGSLRMECRVKGAAITTKALFIGFTDVATIENPIEIGASDVVVSSASNAVGFVYDTDSATDKWAAIGVNADTDKFPTRGGSGANNMFPKLDGATFAPVAAEWQTFAIEINTDGDAVLSFGRDSGSKYGLKEVAFIQDAVAPGTLMVPVICLETRTSGAATADVDYIYVRGGRP